MTKLKEALWGWMFLALIVLYLVGCAPVPKPEVKLSPIFIVKEELSCLTPGTKQQIVKINCQVDYDPTVCPPIKKPK